MKKDQLGPRAASTIPPIAGPNARAALNCAELRVTALSRSSRGTNSDTNACHDPIITPAISPERPTRATTAHGERTPETQMAQSASATTAMPACVTNRTDRRGIGRPWIHPPGPSTRRGRAGRTRPGRPTWASRSARTRRKAPSRSAPSHPCWTRAHPSRRGEVAVAQGASRISEPRLGRDLRRRPVRRCHGAGGYRRVRER